MTNGALFIFNDEISLKRAIEQNGYSPFFAVGEGEQPRWSRGHRQATADLACLQPGGPVYLFARRGIHGLGFLANPAVVLNGDEALAPHPPNIEGWLAGTQLPYQRFVVRFSPEDCRWFPKPVDMDDILAAGGTGMYALRTMENRSFAVFDEIEGMAFEQEVRLANTDAPQLGCDNTGLSASYPLSVPDVNRALGINDELAIETDLVWRLNRGEALDAFDGSWSSALRQVTASPPKPVRYIDRIDVLARRFDSSQRFVREHGIIEIKREGATKKDAEQLMRYVDWVVGNYHQGRFDRVKAYLVAESFGPRLSSALREVALRTFTVEPRRPQARQWLEFSLVEASQQVDGSYAYSKVYDLRGNSRT